jgi:U4/U6.U5 tri-snRNP-associated protein 1
MTDTVDLNTADDMLGPSEDLTGVMVDEDTAALELELALNKARRLNQNKFAKRSNERDIIGLLRAEIIDSTPDLASSISLNSTSEFCRSLGDIPTFGQSGNRDSDEEEEMMVRTPVFMLMHSRTLS